MERLTGRRDGRAYIVGCPDFALPKIAGLIIQQTVDRLATIEDILGDEYDMDRLRELVENDKSCYTCKNYKGEKVCGFKGLDVEINPQEGCVVREAALRREQDG